MRHFHDGHQDGHGHASRFVPLASIVPLAGMGESRLSQHTKCADPLGRRKCSLCNRRGDLAADLALPGSRSSPPRIRAGSGHALEAVLRGAVDEHVRLLDGIAHQQPRLRRSRAAGRRARRLELPCRHRRRFVRGGSSGADRRQSTGETGAHRREHLADWDVTAAAYGRSSTGQVQQLPWWDKWIRHRRPKLVVLVTVDNDFNDNAQHLPGFAHARLAEDGGITLAPPAATVWEAAEGWSLYNGCCRLGMGSLGFVWEIVPPTYSTVWLRGDHTTIRRVLGRLGHDDHTQPPPVGAEHPGGRTTHSGGELGRLHPAPRRRTERRTVAQGRALVPARPSMGGGSANRVAGGEPGGLSEMTAERFCEPPEPAGGLASTT